MDISERRLAVRGVRGAEGRRQRMADSRQENLARLPENLELPISLDEDAALIIQDKATINAERGGKRKRGAKTRAHDVAFALNDDVLEGHVENVEEEEDNTQNEEVSADDFIQCENYEGEDGDVADGNDGENRESQDADDLDHSSLKRARLTSNAGVEDLTVSPERPSRRQMSYSSKKATWLREGFVMPTSDQAFRDLSLEARNVPPLCGFDISVRDPPATYMGGAILKRGCDVDQVIQVEQNDVDHSLDLAGYKLVGLLGFGSKIKKLSEELESTKADLDKAMDEQDKTKKKVGRRDHTIKVMKADKVKMDETLVAAKKIEADMQEEMARMKQDFDSKFQNLEAENQKLNEEVARHLTTCQKLKVDLASAEKKAEVESMELYDQATFHNMRLVAADATEIPAITAARLAKWGSEQIYSEHCRKGHSLVPYSSNELKFLAAEDRLLGKSVWPVPAIAQPNAVTLWEPMFKTTTDALRSAKEQARAALKASTESLEKQRGEPALNQNS